MDNREPFSCAMEIRGLHRPASQGQTTLRNIPLKRNGILAKLGRTRADELQILIPHSSTDSDVSLPHEINELLRVESRMLVDSPGATAAVAYTCLTASPGFDESLFGAICDQLIREIREEHDPAELMIAIVDQWSELLRYAQPPRLSREAVIGLFGELSCLEGLLALGAPPAVESWLGPEGHRHDFSWGNTSVEIKSTVRTDGLHIKVHDADQLTQEDEHELILIAVRLEWNPGGTSLTDLIRRIIANLDDPRLFLERLKLVGIWPDSIDDYREFRFRVNGATIFRVSGDFPAITLATLAEITEESRISQITYALNLTGYPGSQYSSVDAAMWKEILNA